MRRSARRTSAHGCQMFRITQLASDRSASTNRADRAARSPFPDYLRAGGGSSDEDANSLTCDVAVARTRRGAVSWRKAAAYGSRAATGAGIARSREPHHRAAASRWARLESKRAKRASNTSPSARYRRRLVAARRLLRITACLGCSDWRHGVVHRWQCLLWRCSAGNSGRLGGVGPQVVID
jgi:hypothetical protein